MRTCKTSLLSCSASSAHEHVMDVATAAVMAVGHVRIGDSPPRGQPLTREQALAPYGGLGGWPGPGSTARGHLGLHYMKHRVAQLSASVLVALGTPAKQEQPGFLTCTQQQQQLPCSARLPLMPTPLAP